MRALDILAVDDAYDLASGIADMIEADGHRAGLQSRVTDAGASPALIQIPLS
jgi:hypothetical protein